MKRNDAPLVERWASISTSAMRMAQVGKRKFVASVRANDFSHVRENISQLFVIILPKGVDVNYVALHNCNPSKRIATQSLLAVCAAENFERSLKI